MSDASDVDPSLLVRVAALSPGSQRWLKTAIQVIRSGDPGGAEPAERAEAPPPREPSRLPKRAANLEDVITGKADLREQLEAYPELSNELEGLADVIDLLRQAGERRRTRGEEILRELLEGEGETAPPDEEGGDQPPRRPRR